MKLPDKPKSKLITYVLGGLGVLGVGIALFAANTQTTAASPSSTVATAVTAATSSGIKAAKWGKNVTVTYSATKVRLQSNGIPNHSRPAKFAIPKSRDSVSIEKDPTKAQSDDFSIPLKPTWSSSTTAAPKGSIGMMISGAVLYDPFENGGVTVALADNFYRTDTDGTKVWFIDTCSGHPSPPGEYHYHALPGCVASQVDSAAGPSHIIGLALDGYPIYGRRDIRGKTVSLAALDKCNGIKSPTPEFPKGIYHYVLTSAKTAQSSIRCFHGKVDSSQVKAMPTMGAILPLGQITIGSRLVSGVGHGLTRLFCRL